VFFVGALCGFIAGKIVNSYDCDECGCCNDGENLE
jgi:uncharacterized membrane protein YeaQ/YmgE (transglycosylase-associated protein family)